MTHWLDAILVWAAARLDETQNLWIEDLRQEARHVPKGVSRYRFLCSGVLVALGAVLYLSMGPKRVGQALIGTSIFVLCLALFLFTQKLNDPTAKLVVYIVLGLYAIAAALMMLNLRRLKGFALGSSFSLCGIWMALGHSQLVPPDAPLDWIRAFTLEAAVFMVGLFIAASYLGWLEDGRHA